MPPPGVLGLPSNMATAAIVVVLAGAGGTTTPVAGTYALADATSMELVANPFSGWTFSHWIIYGPNLSHGGYPFTATPTVNPYNVNHGYGATYQYQAVFLPAGSTGPTPETSSSPSQSPAPSQAATDNVSRLIDIFQQNALVIIIGFFAVIIVAIVVLKRSK